MLRRLAAIVTIAALVSSCGDDTQDIPDNQREISGAASTATTSAAATAPADTAPADTSPADTADAAGAGTQASGDAAASTCETREAPAARESGTGSAPTDTLDPALTWTLTFVTSCGEFVVTLDPATAPEATASLVALADEGYFDDTMFHRIVPGFVIQGGDPTGSGSGGPGYQTVDEPPADASYDRGVVAMAKAGNEPAGTAGSQFFVVTADAGLPPEYAIVGEVTDGMDVIDRIGSLGDASEKPTQVVVIDSVTAEST